MPQSKKQGRPRTRKPRARVTVNRFSTLPLFPSSRVVPLAYSDRPGLAEAAGGAGITYAYSLNSLFDPNATGTGNQPVGFDEISAIYGQYRVLRCSVRITFMNASTTVSAICGAFATYQPTAPANPDAWVCQPYGKTDRIEAMGGMSSRVVEMDLDIPAVLGVTKQQYASDMDYVGTPSGSPTRQAYLMIYLRSYNASIASAGVFVQLVYHTQFSRPIAMAVS